MGMPCFFRFCHRAARVLHVLENLGRDDDALKYFEKAAAMDSSLILTQLELAKLYERRGDTERARHHYENAAKLAPGDVALWKKHQMFLERINNETPGDSP